VKILYLASPYTSPEPTVRGDRVELASIAAAQLMMQGHCVFSPITHGHHVAAHLTVSTDHEFWMAQCIPILQLCDALMLLPQEGWRQSRGVAEELAFARVNNIPVYIIQDLPWGFGHRLETLPDTELTANGWSRLAFD